MRLPSSHFPTETRLKTNPNGPTFAWTFERMSPFSNPKLAEIDEALTELEPYLVEFGRAKGFTLMRSHEGSYNVPRRWLRRDFGTSPVVRHEVGLVIAAPMPERLERGFFPEIPCSMYIAAFSPANRMHYDAIIFEAQPFFCLRQSLAAYLRDAAGKLEGCTGDFILRNGKPDPLP